MSNYFGIDFGTTNSAVVWLDSLTNRLRTIGDLDNHPVPTVVAVEILTQKVECGRAVKQQWRELSECGEYYLIDSVKSCLDEDKVWATYDGQGWTPRRVAGELFRYLSQCTGRVSTQPINQAVVAIPIGMNAAKRAVLRQAARTAGIEILSFVSEPTAACIANLDAIKHYRYVAVFDWGGGTLDISILELRDNCLTELSLEPWNTAGDKIDQLFAEWMHQRLAEKNGIKTSFGDLGKSTQQLLINAAEECKRELQVKEEAQVQLWSYEGRRERMVVKQEDFNCLVKPIIKGAVDRLFHSVEKAGISAEAIGCLLLVGGSSKLTALEPEIRLRWPSSPNILAPEDAEWAIAKGAAILAANPGKYRLAESIGLRLDDDQFHAILRAGTPLDEASNSLHFGLVEDSRTASFVFETAKKDISQSAFIGELHADAFGFNDEVIELKSRVTEDLIFEATARSDKRQSRSHPFNHNELRWMYELPNIS